jgi:hypothetical protein
MPSSPAIAVTVRREPKWVTTCPASGSDTIEPAAMASSTKPSRDGVSSRPSRTCGIRDAHDDIAKPEPMNATYVARVAARTSVVGVSTAVAGFMRTTVPRQPLARLPW